MARGLGKKIKKEYGTIKHYSKTRGVKYSTLRLFLCKYPNIQMPRYEEILKRDGFIKWHQENYRK